jgi:hypothetical protein
VDTGDTKVPALDRLLLSRMCLVGWIDVGKQGERVKDLRFGVVGIAGGEIPHGPFITPGTGLIRDRVCLTEDEGDCGDVLPLACGTARAVLRNLNLALRKRNGLLRKRRIP